MLLTEAIAFAAKCHENQKRKSTNTPYIVHPMEACAIAATMTSDPEVLAAAVLHDVCEDCGISIQALKDRFGHRVANLVEAESELKDYDSEGSWMRRKQHTISKLQTANEQEMIITLADKLSNIRSICRDYEEIGDTLWERFSHRDMSLHAWYYQAIGDNLRNMGESAALTEYASLVERVFGGAKAI